MGPHERLDVWKKAVDIVVLIYETTPTFPDEEKYGLTLQIRRASVSISANVAEGEERASTRELLQFLSNAQGSASEVSTGLLIAKRIGILKVDSYRKLDDGLTEIGRMITGLGRHLKRSFRSSLFVSDYSADLTWVKNGDR